MPDIPEYNETRRLNLVIERAYFYTKEWRHECVMPEHFLLALLDNTEFRNAISYHIDADELFERVATHLDGIEPMPEGMELNPQRMDVSEQTIKMIRTSFEQVQNSSAQEADIPHIVQAMLELEESWAAYLLKEVLGDEETDFMVYLITQCELRNEHTWEKVQKKDENIPESDDFFQEKEEHNQPSRADWRQWVTCMNDSCHKRNPLIGREDELQRTIQVLCRCDKNNPLHVGEPGVGKTALVWGLAQKIVDGNVPARLKYSKIYQLDLGTLLAGTKYRGDFEKRMKQIMDGILNEGDNNIVYIDEIHTLVGAGAVGESAMDASNMLKPYLESGNVRFIGSTTYEEYNKHFSRSKGMIRRFQQIDILEPSVEETIHILQQLRPRYEQFHHVEYTPEAISYAVEASAKYINERFLPDKAIDLIDEAGAAAEVSGADSQVDKKAISEILAKMCKVANLSEEEDDNEYAALEQLESRMLSQIFGQDEAVRQVVEAVQMSKAGLLDDGKPLSSLLFVGPTGVGKTEIAKVLSKELSIPLVRFDMSEYTEKHAVAKLIGSPAGYIGYDDGGLLTDTIRKTPHCVLLLDEIEKAHEEIYNILLQVMDYAQLTDNKGRHADFRNVIIIMTSNAGAQLASHAMVGFGGSTSRGETMLKQVKRTFKPEFINRLSSVVVFHDMNQEMAQLILQKKLRQLDEKLLQKNVHLTLSPSAMAYLLAEGYTKEYGAREMDRVIAQKVKPLLMREILFGQLKQGGSITIDYNEADACLSIG